MPNIVRTLAQLLARWLDAPVGNITAQTGRDFLASAFGWSSTADPSPQNDSVDTAGIGQFFDTGSRWTDTANNTAWFCIAGTPNAAVWVPAPQALTLKVQAGVVTFTPATVPAASTLSFDSTIFSVGPQNLFPSLADITIKAGAILNSLLANMPATTIKGNNAGSSGPPLDLNPSQVVVMLPTFPPAGVGHGVGIVPDPGSTVHSPAWYLGDDALWHALPGGGGVTAVTATSPLASSGGATPDISLSGVVPIAKGGTGLASWGNNEIVVTDGSGNIAPLPLGTTNQVLTVVAGAPAWATPPTTPVWIHRSLTFADFDPVTLVAVIESFDATGTLLIFYHQITQVFLATAGVVTNLQLGPNTSPGSYGIIANNLDSNPTEVGAGSFPNPNVGPYQLQFDASFGAPTPPLIAGSVDIWYLKVG